MQEINLLIRMDPHEFRGREIYAAPNTASHYLKMFTSCHTTAQSSNFSSR